MNVTSTFKNIVFVLGGPGSGKGTQCSRIVSDFNFTHLSTGDLLRSEVEKGSSIGRELEEIMQQGKLVPSETVVALLKDAMMEKGNSPGFLIDGFPRELYQAKLFEDDVCECTQVLVLECSDAVMTRRLLQRGQTSGRVDDNEATIKKRLATFRQETLPVIEFYKRKHLVCSVRACMGIDVHVYMSGFTGIKYVHFVCVYIRT
jgi:adenylate kinase